METAIDGGTQEMAVIGLLLLAWFRAGEALPGTSISAHYVMALLVLAAALRVLAARLHCGALLNATLALDAYAITVLFGDHRRQRRRSPRREALLFAAAMPLERELQSRLGSDLLRAPLPAVHS